MLAAVEMRAGHSWLRSSPTPEGRCCQWPVAAQPPAGTDVAILTDPGGSVLPRTRARFRRGGSGCDPHRPRRVGAAPPGWRRRGGPRRRLRSSPTPEGRCCSRSQWPSAPSWSRLRSSPTPEGRCCSRRRRSAGRAACRRCDPHRPRRVGAAQQRRRRLGQHDRVAILTDPGGSVLHQLPSGSSMTQVPSLRSSPTPEGRCCAAARCPPPPPSLGCDPHRPRRVGAACPGSAV